MIALIIQLNLECFFSNDPINQWLFNYFETNYQEKDGINIEKLLYLLHPALTPNDLREKVKKLSSPIFIFNKPIYDVESKNIVQQVGVTNQGVPRYSVVSSYRFRGINDEEFSRCFKAVLYHEIGHYFNAPPEDIPDRMKDFGLHHYTDSETGDGTLCVLRKGRLRINNWKRFADDIERTGVIYCNKCFNTIKDSLINMNSD